MSDSKAGLPITPGWTNLWAQCGYLDWRVLCHGRIADALSFASLAHFGQTRKGGTPYILHPIRVLVFVQTALKVIDTVVCVGALLHDTVEDIEFPQEQRDSIKSNFGETVASLVNELTNDESLPFREKKAKMIKKARSFSSRARIIKASDRIDNLLDMVLLGDKKWLSRYLPESRELLVSLREIDDLPTNLGRTAVVACDYLESVIRSAETFSEEG